MQPVRVGVHERALVAALTLAIAVLGLAADPAAAAPYPWAHDLARDVVTLPPNHGPSPHVVDWNADGREDLLVGFRQVDQHGGIGVLLRREDGSLADPVSVFASGNAGTPTGFALYFRPVTGDWDGDGAKDLVYGQLYGLKGVVLCGNEGTDAAPVFRGESCEVMRTAGGAQVGTTGAFGHSAYLSPEVLDWDEDGDLDLLVGSGVDATEKGVRLYRNTGSATAPSLADPETVVAKASTPGLAFENAYEPAVVDVDDDGRKDLLIAGAQYQPPSNREFVLRQCLNTGTDTAPAFASCSHAILPGFVHNTIDAHDWDGDGFLDLLRGYFSAFITNPVTLLHGESPDSDGDGTPDSFDNCRAVSNPASIKLDRDNPVQVDTDGDGLGDACDDDVDGDGVLDGTDVCVLASDPEQADADGDERGDACDPRDDRPGHPGVGSYEWEMAEKLEWGRKPAIVMRADAMSRGYRQEIAERLTTEALERDMAFSLAVIPWDEARFRSGPGDDFLREVADDPNFEAVQHGTYHACVDVDGVITDPAEFGATCGMDAAESFNVMRVGRNTLASVLAEVDASQPLTGFVPPADAFNAGAREAMTSLGYRYLASAHYNYRHLGDGMYHTDDEGLVHIPWSQIACGNGAATWTDCGDADLEAHAGVDCADEALCRPSREADPKDYSDWEAHADTRLAERCRNDFDRYGLCAVLFELTSYDADFATGAPDETAMAGYELTLDELDAMAEEEGAVFLTLGQYAAAQQMEDATAPAIRILSPDGRAYGHDESVVVDVDVTDDLSGVHRVDVALDGEPVADGATVDLGDLALGAHTVTVEAEDTAGNVAQSSVTFEVVDTTPPEIAIASPQAAAYGHHETVAVDVDVVDVHSEVARVDVTLDGRTVAADELIDLHGVALGEHTVAVEAEDSAGNVATADVTFRVVASVETLTGSVQRLVEEGDVDRVLARSLLAKLEQADAAASRGASRAAANLVAAFADEVDAQRGKKVAESAAELLLGDAAVVRTQLLGPEQRAAVGALRRRPDRSRAVADRPPVTGG